MRRLAACALLVLVGFGLTPLRAQEPPAVQGVRQAYQALRYDSVIARGRRAIANSRGLSRENLVSIYELLAYAYGAMDSTTRAVEAFRELIRLDPDREPDVTRVAPRITSLYASALGQVVVIRRVRADTASFIAGQGAYAIRFRVTRPSRVTARVVGPGLDTLIDSIGVAGEGLVTWRAVTPEGPARPGRYQVVLDAASGREEFERAVAFDLSQSAVDTLAHITRLEGYDVRPETMRPPRSLAPVARAMLVLVAGVGAALAVENTSHGSQEHTGLTAAGAGVFGAGLVVSLRRPDPVPVEANIEFNRLLREQIARRNAEIVRTNAERRVQTMIHIAPLPEEES